jgi:hypothetical protein
MITARTSDMEAQLARNPEDWSLRIRLIEGCVRRDDMAGARSLVRESPDDSPLPPELQFRLHTLMVHGSGAFAILGEPEMVAETADVTPPAAVSSHPLPPDPAERAPVAQTRPQSSERHHPQPVPPKGASVPVSEKAADPAPVEPPVKTNAAGGKEIGLVRLDLKALREKEARRWETYRGGLRLESALELKTRERQAQVGQKISAFTMALLFHVAVIILIGFIVISVPRQPPPQLIATVEMPKRPSEIPIPPKVARTDESKPSAASSVTPNVIGALSESPISIPEMEMTQSVDVTAQITGVAPVGEGLSFSGDAREVSDVNFFGISAGGKRIVFIVDATPEMLVDEKGGMFAYDKVKDEIGIMLAGLNRGTKFNILLYEGGRLLAFAEEPVTAMPSALRMAIEWLQPLNRTYERLGLNGHDGQNLEVAGDIEPIPARDVAHYTKAIQKAIEWEASTIFCISGGYRQMRRSLSPEEMEAYRKDREKNPGTPGTVDPKDREAWNQAQQRAREWLQQENAARAAKGLPPKVVIDFNQLVEEVTGATPPRATGGSPGAAMPRMEPYTPEDIEALVRNGVKDHFRGAGLEPPSLHLVAFLGEDEPMDDQTKEHFQSLTRKNNGKFKLLRGLAALENVTGKK